MMNGSPEVPVLELRGVTRQYAGLRPLRIAGLEIASGERVAIGGIDAGAAELLVNLVTGATLPDAGEVRVFGRSTADITTGDEWLASLDAFGIVSPRAVLLEGATLLQALAMPFTLEIDPVPPEIGAQVRQLAARCGIDSEALGGVVGRLAADVRVRANLARALALQPRLILVEHPTAGVEPAALEALAADIVRACGNSGPAMLVLTNDDAFGRAVAPRHLRLDGATGTLKPVRKGWFTS